MVNMRTAGGEWFESTGPAGSLHEPPPKIRDGLRFLRNPGRKCGTDSDLPEIGVRPGFQSGWMLAAFTTFAHFRRSCRMVSANSAGPAFTMLPPSVVSRFAVSGAATVRAIASYRRVTMPRGVA